MNFVNPLISIIITTRNSEFNIENSILSALNQTYKHIEIIIVDHHSEDKTLEICKKFNHLPFFYILNNHDSKNLIFKGSDINAGFSSRNLGIEFSNGEWISFIDGGDLIDKSKLEIQLKLAKKFNCLHILTGYKEFNKNNNFSAKFIKSINFDSDLNFNKLIFTNDLLNLLKSQNDLAAKMPIFLRRNFPLHIRQSYKLRKFISPDPMNSFPGAGSSVFFHKSIKTRYRSLRERKWSSSKGRGADRDFNFQVLESYKCSLVTDLPLVYWGV